MELIHVGVILANCLASGSIFVNDRISRVMSTCEQALGQRS
jgi:hypothetical protein